MRCAAVGRGTATFNWLRERASWKACWTAAGAPSPIWQHGAVTATWREGLDTPLTVAVTSAFPPPMAFTVAVAPLGVRLRTVELVTAQVTGRPVTAAPEEVNASAFNCAVSFRLSFSAVVKFPGPVMRTAATGSNTTGVFPTVY